MAIYGQRAQTPEMRRYPDRARVMLQARVTREQHQKAHRAAALLNVSVSAFMAELVDRLEVDEQGRPSWESRYARPDEDDQPRLNLTA